MSVQQSSGSCVGLLWPLLLASTAAAEIPLPDDVEYPITVTLTGGIPGEWHGNVAELEVWNGFVDGPRGVARLDWPIDLEFGPDGKLYVLDERDAAVRVVDMDGTVTTLVGAKPAEESSRRPDGGLEREFTGRKARHGYLDGPPSVACFGLARTEQSYRAIAPGQYCRPGLDEHVFQEGPKALAFGPDGDLYVLDNINWAVRHIPAEGVVTTAVGSRHEVGPVPWQEAQRAVAESQGADDLDPAPAPDVPGAVVWCGPDCDVSQAQDAVIERRDGPSWPFARDLASGPDGLMYVVESDGVSRIADGQVRAVTDHLQLNAISLGQFVGVSPDGTYWVTDHVRNVLIQVSADGAYPLTNIEPHPGRKGDWRTVGHHRDGPRGVGGAEFLYKGVRAPDGNLYVGSGLLGSLRRVEPDGYISTVAGGRLRWLRPTGAPERYGPIDGPLSVATLGRPRSVTYGPDGCFYIADRQNHAIRKIIPRPPGHP